MRFHLWRKSDRQADRAAITDDDPDPLSPIDLDRWAAADTPGRTDERDPDVLALRDKLLEVLADEEASLVPPVAGDMTQAEWDALEEGERESYRRLQLKRVDPRFVPSYTTSQRHHGSRSSRVYR